MVELGIESKQPESKAYRWIKPDVVTMSGAERNIRFRVEVLSKVYLVTYYLVYYISPPSLLL